MSVVSSNEGWLFFIYGYRGTGNTFLWRTLSTALHSNGHIVLNVASSGITSLLSLRGRITHSRFSITLIVNESSTCHIEQGSFMANLLVKTRLIIWDEAPMVNKYCSEALDRTERSL